MIEPFTIGVDHQGIVHRSSVPLRAGLREPTRAERAALRATLRDARDESIEVLALLDVLDELERADLS